MEENIIYIYQNESLWFEAKCQYTVPGYDDKITIGVQTDNVTGIIQCIQSVNNTIFLLKEYGAKAILFTEGKESYEEFAKKVGGRENIKSPDYTLPIKILKKNG